MFAELHIERGRIRAILPCTVGTIIRTETDSCEFPGCHVMPGFVDSHAHVVGLGERLSGVSLHAASSAQQCARLIADSLHKSSEWIEAMGWNHERWGVADLPSREVLDRVSASVPIVAMRVDGHAMWVNSAALRRAGIDPHDHSGILIDDAMRAVWEIRPVTSSELLRSQILAATSQWVRHGVTEIHDMDVAPGWLETFRQLAESGELPVRIQSFVSGQQREWQRDGILPTGGELHRIAGVKMFADGALGSRGALLRSPYSDASGHVGLELLSVPEMIERMTEIIDAGWQCIAVHAIGDAAVRNVLDAYTSVREMPAARDAILRIEHAQHVTPEDVERFAQLSVLACVQPVHCISDAQMAEKRLGSDRLPWSYRWRSLIDAGVIVTGGSDAPIESAAVLDGIRAFVERIPHGQAEPWYTSECISSAEAVDAYTLQAHRASGMEYRRGRIEVGFDADLVVVSHDLARLVRPISDEVSVRATFTAGRLRYAE